jgi:hypothetical protein
MCWSVYLGLYKAHAQGDCCEAMHACVGVCIWACTRRMLRVIAARRCMRELVCVLPCTSRMLRVIACIFLIK